MSDDNHDPESRPNAGAEPHEARPSASASAGTGEAVPPRAPFEPPIRDKNVVAILKGLNPSPDPIPAHSASTDGDLAAVFSSPPRPVPHAAAPPVEEDKVVVRPASHRPRNEPGGEAGNAGKAGGRPKEVQRARAGLDTTFRISPSRRPDWVLPLAAVIVLLGAGAAFWVVRTPAAAPPSAPSTTSQPPVASPASPAAPSGDPRIPPPPVDDTPSPTTSSSPAPAVPERAAPPIKASPASSPATKPAKGPPSRRKEDEPERVL